MALPPERYISFFSGIGALDVAVERVFPQAQPLCYVENDAANILRLAARMEEGSLTAAPVWSDARSFPVELFRGRADLAIGGSPARTCLSRVSGPASEGSGAACSSPSSAPFAVWESATSSWRTWQLSLWDASSTPFLGRWPKSGSLRSGGVYERPTLVRLMAEIVGGASRGMSNNWPTPQAADGERQSEQQMRGNPTLLGTARIWPTPSASVPNDGESPETWRVRQTELKAKHINGAGVPLAIAAQEAMSFWMTPNVPNGGRVMSADDVAAKGSTDRGKRQVDLASQARHWSTPLGTEPRQGYKGGSTFQQSLSTEAVDALSGLLVPTTEPGGKPFSPGGRTLHPQLSALFVEWLRGLPLGWSCVCVTGVTVSVDLETLSSRNALPRRSRSSGIAPLESGRD